MPDADTEISRKDLMDAFRQSGRWERAELALAAKAWRLGASWHAGQKRASGKDYFKGHCAHVALHLHELRMPTSTIIAGLLHDTIEDTEADRDLLEKEFGPEIAFLVDGVSNLGLLKYRNYKRHVASLRKFFVAVAKDTRVIAIKLCDRCHNLKTLKYLPAEKQRRIAEESMLVHAQLAQRLHITQLVQQINDNAFPFVYPEDCQRVRQLQKASLKKAEVIIGRIYRQCLQLLHQNLGYTPTIDRRIKSTYSLYKKLLDKDWNIDAIYDIIALRIIVRDLEGCYKTLGLIHGRWQPLPNRFKDYIASPKTNGYQSLHTIIFSGDGRMVEIQIKTAEMHQIAEFGLAAHIDYKSAGAKRRIDWLDQLKILKNPQRFDIHDYLKELRTDFFADRIFVRTPLGDVIDLPRGATVLDFAFAIHTDIGLKARGGRINGVYKALKTPLQEQDIVEIATDKKVSPQRDWLTWAKTPLARQQIKAYLNKQAPEQK